MSAMTHLRWHDSLMCMPLLTYGTTYVHVCYGSSSTTWRTHVCTMIHVCCDLCLRWVIIFIYVPWCVRYDSCILWFTYVKSQHSHSKRKSDLKYLHLQIIQLSWILFWVTGTPFTQLKTCWNFWGLLRKRVWYVRGPLWKPDGIFGSRNYIKSVLLRRWWLMYAMIYLWWLMYAW